MTKFYMSDGEIITDFRQAKDQTAQIEILADQNCVTKAQMREKLRELGLLPNEAPVHTKRQPVRKKRKVSMEDLLLGAGQRVNGKLDEARAKELYDQGLGDQRIANALNVAKSTVASWRKRIGLPNHQQLVEMKQAETEKTESGTAAEKDTAMKKEGMLAGIEATKPEEVNAVAMSAGTTKEAPSNGGILTVRGLCAITQRLLDFGLGDAHVSIGGKPIEDFQRVTVQLGGNVQIDLS